MMDDPDKGGLQALQNELEEFLRVLPGDAASNRQTVDLLKAKGYSDEAIMEFLRGNS